MASTRLDNSKIDRNCQKFDQFHQKSTQICPQFNQLKSTLIELQYNSQFKPLIDRKCPQTEKIDLKPTQIRPKYDAKIAKKLTKIQANFSQNITQTQPKKLTFNSNQFNQNSIKFNQKIGFKSTQIPPKIGHLSTRKCDSNVPTIASDPIKVFFCI